jgi:hypothetical protein
MLQGRKSFLRLAQVSRRIQLKSNLLNMRLRCSMKYALIAILLVVGAKSYGQKANAKKSFAKHVKILDSF